MTEKICKICGKTFYGSGATAYCGDECRKIGYADNIRLAESRARIRKASKRSRKKQTMSIADISKEARAVGMSYGQYVARMNQN